MSRKKEDNTLEKFGIHIIGMDSPEYKHGITHEQAVKRGWRIAILILIAAALWLVPGYLTQVRGDPEANILGFLIIRAISAFGVFVGAPCVAGILVLICKISWGIYKWILRKTFTLNELNAIEAEPVKWNDFFEVIIFTIWLILFIWGAMRPYFFETIVSIINRRVYFY